MVISTPTSSTRETLLPPPPPRHTHAILRLVIVLQAPQGSGNLAHALVTSAPRRFSCGSHTTVYKRRFPGRSVRFFHCTFLRSSADERSRCGSKKVVTAHRMTNVKQRLALLSSVVYATPHGFTCFFPSVHKSARNGRSNRFFFFFSSAWRRVTQLKYGLMSLTF